MKYKFAFSGSGGQGAALMAKLLCLGSIGKDYKVVMTQTYGIEQRGGDSTGYVVVSDRPVGNPVVEGDADISVALSPSMYLPALEGTAPQGTLFVNSSLVTDVTPREEITQIRLPVSEAAVETGSIRCANLVMLGAVIARTGLLAPQDLLPALKETMGKKSAGLVEMNFQALKRGAALQAREV